MLRKHSSDSLLLSLRLALKLNFLHEETHYLEVKSKKKKNTVCFQVIQQI